MASGLLNYNKALPLKYLNGLKIELHWETAGVALATGTEYVINEPRFYFTAVQPSAQVIAELSKLYQKGELNLYFDTWKNRSYVTGSGATDIAFDLSASVLNAKNVFVVMRNNAVLTSGSDSFVFISRDFGTTDGADASHYVFKWNDINIPNEPVQSKERAYNELLKATGTYGNVLFNPVKYKDYISTKFVIGEDLERMTGVDAFSGLSLQDGKNIRFEIKFASNDTPSALVYRFDSFVLCTTVVNMSANNGVRIKN
jgi:hypothetical protein